VYTHNKPIHIPVRYVYRNIYYNVHGHVCRVFTNRDMCRPVFLQRAPIEPRKHNNIIYIPIIYYYYALLESVFYTSTHTHTRVIL